MDDPIHMLIMIGVVVLWLAAVVVLFSSGHWILALVVLALGTKL